MNSIYEFVKRARDDCYSKVIEVVPGYEFSQYETLRTIELYHGSKFKSGSKDSLKREKLFYNICKFRVNVLSEKDYEPWLSGAARTELLRPAAEDLLQRWPVSKRVNSSREPDDDPKLTDRIAL
jgi:hypothetical protein